MDDIDWNEGAAIWLPVNFATGQASDKKLMDGSLKDAVQYVRAKGSEQGFVIRTDSGRVWAGVALWGLTAEVPD